MPDSTDEKKETSKWITIGGKKIEIPAGEEGEDAIREATESKNRSVRGMKESNTKQAQKAYQARFGIYKTLFKIRDAVVFDKYNREGVISGFAGDNLTIMSEGRVYKQHKDQVFKKEELLEGGVHWDTLTKADRVPYLTKANLDSSYSTRNWANLPPEIRGVIKEASPAGMSTATAGVHNPIYNPINEEKPVSDRIDEEIARQHKDTGREDEKKGKD